MDRIDRRKYLIKRSVPPQLYVGEPQPTVPTVVQVEPLNLRTPIICGDIYIHSDGKQFNISMMQQITWSGLNNHGTLPYLLVDGVRLPRVDLDLDSYEAITWRHPNAIPNTRLFEVYPGIAIQVPYEKCSMVPYGPLLVGLKCYTEPTLNFLVPQTGITFRRVDPTWERYPYCYERAYPDPEKKDSPGSLRSEHFYMLKNYSGAVLEKVDLLYPVFWQPAIREDLDKKRKLLDSVRMFYEVKPKFTINAKPVVLDIVLTGAPLVTEVIPSPLSNVHLDILCDFFGVYNEDFEDGCKALGLDYSSFEYVNKAIKLGFKLGFLPSHCSLSRGQACQTYKFDEITCMQDQVEAIEALTLSQQMILALKWSSQLRNSSCFLRMEVIDRIQEDAYDMCSNMVDSLNSIEYHNGNSLDIESNSMELMLVHESPVQLNRVYSSDLLAQVVEQDVKWKDRKDWDIFLHLGNKMPSISRMRHVMRYDNCEQDLLISNLARLIVLANEKEKLKGNDVFEILLPVNSNDAFKIYSVLTEIARYNKVVLCAPPYNWTGTISFRIGPGRTRHFDHVYYWLRDLHTVYAAYIMLWYDLYLTEIGLLVLRDIKPP